MRTFLLLILSIIVLAVGYTFLALLLRAIGWICIPIFVVAACVLFYRTRHCISPNDLSILRNMRAKKDKLKLSPTRNIPHPSTYKVIIRDKSPPSAGEYRIINSRRTLH